MGRMSPTERKPIVGLYHETESTIDGAPIVLIFNGIARPSENAKTGPMIQAFILRRDSTPLDAYRDGTDRSICGDCPLRSACYVERWRLGDIWRAYRSGTYQRLDLDDHRHVAALRSRPIRFGAYGDPAAVPWSFWSRFLLHVLPVSGWTGYTHQWRRFPALRWLVMASVETEEDARDAQAQGWRTFRVRAPGEDLLPNEISCPASAEAGHRITCDRCRACDGRGRDVRPSVSIVVHGSRASRFQEVQP